jgi:hypothetical protein
MSGCERMDAPEAICRRFTAWERGVLIGCGALVGLGVILFWVGSWRDVHGLSPASLYVGDDRWLEWGVPRELPGALLLVAVAWLGSHRIRLTWRGITILLGLYATVPAFGVAVLAACYHLTTGAAVALDTLLSEWGFYLYAWGAGCLLGLGTAPAPTVECISQAQEANG